MEVTCNKCGWVHFAISRTHAEREVEEFNKFYDTLSPELQQEYYGGKGSTITQYEHCFFCGNTFKDFRISKPGDCPVGCTIQPIISDLI